MRYEGMVDAKVKIGQVIIHTMAMSGEFDLGFV